MPSRKLLTIAVLGAALFAGLAALFWTSQSDPNLSAGTLLPQRRPIGEFKLLDHQGRNFAAEDFKGHWSLLFLGFTSCPDICPTTLSMLATLDTKLRAKGGEVQTVFLSADPKRDTPPVVAKYLSHFNPRFVGLTGEKVEIDKLCAYLSLGYVKNPGVGADYTVDHSGALVLIDPQARVAAYFQPPHDLNALVADLTAMTRSKM